MSKSCPLATVSRNDSFDQTNFFKQNLAGEWRIFEEDSRSVALSELEIEEIKTVNLDEEKIENFSGEEVHILLRARGFVRLDAKFFLFFLENPHHIPVEWSDLDESESLKFIYFDGTVFQNIKDKSLRAVLYLFNDGDQWGWNVEDLDDLRLLSDLSAVIG